MKVGVLGGTHLGQVTAACLAHVGHEVTVFGKASAVEEPGLDELRMEGTNNRRLVRATYEWDARPALAALEEVRAAVDCRLLWCCQDTPVDAEDRSNVGAVVKEILRLARAMPAGGLLVVSSQVPVGTTRALRDLGVTERNDMGLTVAYSPENLRRRHALADFLHPARVVVGTEDGARDARIEELFAPIAATHDDVGSMRMPGAAIQWMSYESAECAKHALNALLGACIALSNEVGELARAAGADPADVERALR